MAHAAAASSILALTCATRPLAYEQRNEQLTPMQHKKNKLFIFDELNRIEQTKSLFDSMLVNSIGALERAKAYGLGVLLCFNRL